MIPGYVNANSFERRMFDKIGPSRCPTEKQLDKKVFSWLQLRNHTGCCTVVQGCWAASQGGGRTFALAIRYRFYRHARFKDGGGMEIRYKGSRKRMRAGGVYQARLVSLCEVT